MILVAAWACCMSWGSDTVALIPGTDHFSMYMTILGLIGVVALTFELGDWLRGFIRSEPEREVAIDL